VSGHPGSDPITEQRSRQYTVANVLGYANYNRLFGVMMENAG
jgi:hypothetical protein